MTLLLDGHKVQGKNLKVTANLRIESGDMSGQTSNTDTAHKGFKPKTLTISLMIPFVDNPHMTDLMRLAESTASGGQMHLYRIVNDTAEAFGIRQVEFSEGISAREDDTLRAWLIQFTLSERQSNPEKVEGRRAGNAVNAQGAPGSAVGTSGEGKDETTDNPALSGFEKVLGRVDKWLGGSEST
ncbi:DNA-binding protein [Pseudomonas sp. ADAK2]|uniref:baseplate complex protein n=1 Tax=unclassified Pseudomonas TaxID=196821 RepID=UPI0014635281|nr:MULTISPECIES: DNA-binding protein [unclassified Pseudomonas]QJI41413.1 DNA-binding protein [Pseudomonas sp. ADAK7]QJI47717.1 DNA-binding protein [Pseudomonas sp. ADAK2]